MLVIVGAIIVTVCVFGGYAFVGGGHLDVIWQPSEYIIIGGAGIGGLLTSTSPGGLKALLHQVLASLKGPPVSKPIYLQALMLLFELTKTAKANPLSLEPHVEKPETSEIFKKYPAILHNHHAIEFICDTLKVQISSPMSPYDLEELMDADIQTVHEEEARAPSLVQKTGDAMPGLGIVAAVLGVVHTMGKLSEGKEAVGNSVAAALVGTFLGILISYGFLQPLAAKMELNNAESGKLMSVIKAALLAYAKNCSPKVCVEFARRTIPAEYRPSFEEVDKATSGAGKAAA
jgi:chemotaxis protein MotA